MIPAKKCICLILCFVLLIGALPINIYSISAAAGVAITGIVGYLWGRFQDDIIDAALSYISVESGEVFCEGREGEDSSHSYQLDHYEYDDNQVLQPVYVCSYCGNVQKVINEAFDQAYDDYVSTLPATGVDSEGGLIWHPTIYDVAPDTNFSVSYGGSLSRNYTDINGVSVSFLYSGYATTLTFSGYIKASFLTPFDGYYSLLASNCCSGVGNSQDASSGEITSYNLSSEYEDHSFGYLPSGYSINIANSYTSNSTPIKGRWTLISLVFNTPSFRVIPYSVVGNAEFDTIYNINTRTTNIQGDLGYYVDGELQVIENQRIVNETNNTYNNPVTGDTYDMTGWSYDYSDRSYTIDLSTGDTVSVTYGDENITINEGGTTYTVYYVIQQPTTTNPVIPDHTHHYTFTESADATCTENGYSLYTCLDCGEIYRDIVYASGHNWVFQELVPAVYDDETGDLVSSSYNIYYCTNCQETTIVPVGGDPPSIGVSELNSFAANLMGWLANFMAWLNAKFEVPINVSFDPHLLDDANINFNIDPHLFDDATFDVSLDPHLFDDFTFQVDVNPNVDVSVAEDNDLYNIEEEPEGQSFLVVVTDATESLVAGFMMGVAEGAFDLIQDVIEAMTTLSFDTVDWLYDMLDTDSIRTFYDWFDFDNNPYYQTEFGSLPTLGMKVLKCSLYRKSYRR